MPKCSTSQIESELSKLEGSGLVCAVAYLKAELKRRKGSAKNVGRKATNDTPKHRKWRAASARYRSRKIREKVKEIDESVVKSAEPELDRSQDWGA